jgi:hypothetical protein
MPKLTLNIPHQLPPAEVKRRIQDEVARLEGQLGHLVGRVEQRWTDNTLDFRLSAAGQSLTGQAVVAEREVRLEVDLPWMLSLLAGGLRQQIEQRGRRLLGHDSAKPA